MLYKSNTGKSVSFCIQKNTVTSLLHKNSSCIQKECNLFLRIDLYKMQHRNLHFSGMQKKYRNFPCICRYKNITQEHFSFLVVYKSKQIIRLKSSQKNSKFVERNICSWRNTLSFVIKFYFILFDADMCYKKSKKIFVEREILWVVQVILNLFSICLGHYDKINRACYMFL